MVQALVASGRVGVIRRGSIEYGTLYGVYVVNDV